MAVVSASIVIRRCIVPLRKRFLKELTVGLSATGYYKLGFSRGLAKQRWLAGEKEEQEGETTENLELHYFGPGFEHLIYE